MREFPFLTFEEQLNLFETRGIKIKDREKALEKISNINYYKLKEFAEHFQKKDSDGNIYYENISFEGLIKSFYTDKNLRIYLLDALEKVEISVKTKMGHVFGKHYGATGFNKFNNWCNKNEYCKHYIRYQENEFKHRINGYIGKRKTPSIREFLAGGGKIDIIPIWMIIELFTFGDIVKIYELMSNRLRKEIASNYGLEAETFEKYLKNLNLVRNLSAHNTKIIDLKLVTLPPFNETWKEYLSTPHNGIATTLVILDTLVMKINPKYGFGNIHKTLNNYINHKDIKAQELGFKDHLSINFFYRTK